MSINLAILAKCIAICLCAGLIGFRLGRNVKPRPEGIIEIERNEGGEFMTSFKLAQGLDWIAQQDTILFKVYNPYHVLPDPLQTEGKTEEKES